MSPFATSLISPRFRTLGWTLLLGWGVSDLALANGVRRDGAGARSMALGGAGLATPEGPLEAAAGNPAGFREPSLQLGGWGGVVDGQFSNRANPQGNLDSNLGVAPELAVSVPLGDSPVALGFGIVPEAAAGLDWQLNDTPGGATGTTSYGRRRHHAEFLALRTVAGLSVALHETLTIGASTGATYTRNVLEAPYVFQSHPALRGLKTLLDLETDGWGMNGALGLVYRPHPDLSLGLSYQAPTSFETTGVAEGNAGEQLRDLGGGFAGVRPDFRYDARVMTALPQVVSAGFTWQATEWLRWVGQVEWADWSNAFDRLDITLTGGNNADLNGFLGTDRIDDTVPLRWKDTWVFRTGFEVPVSDAIRLRAGYAFGESPVPAETMTPMSAAILEHLVTAGAEWTRDRWSIGLAYQYGFESSQGVGASDLRSGEFTGSSTRLEFHGFGLTTTYRY